MDSADCNHSTKRVQGPAFAGSAFELEPFLGRKSLDDEEGHRMRRRLANRMPPPVRFSRDGDSPRPATHGAEAPTPPQCGHRRGHNFHVGLMLQREEQRLIGRGDPPRLSADSPAEGGRDGRHHASGASRCRSRPVSAENNRRTPCAPRGQPP
jgi:hypothetical protein